jgi:outer membrane murein-binding lipoprotein Lpp
MGIIKTIGIVIAVVIGLTVVFGCIGSDDKAATTVTNNNEQTQTIKSDTPAVTQTQTQETIIKAAPVTITTFSGSSTKDTETFHVDSDQCRIAWDTKAGQYAGNFIFTVHNADGSYKASGANVIGTNSDSTIVRGSGDYYLSIITAQPYEITVSTI